VVVADLELDRLALHQTTLPASPGIEDTLKGVKDEATRERLRAQWRANGAYLPLTVGAVIADAARRDGGSEIVFAPVDAKPETVSLAALYAAALRVAGALLHAGVRPGDVVAVQAPIDRVSTEVLEALWLLGTVVVPIVVTAGGAEIGHIVRESGASTLVVAPEYRDVPLAATAAANAAAWGLARVLTLGDDAPPGAVAVDDLRQDGGFEVGPPSPSEVCCVLYTSGSTAVPKGVQHTHETLLAGLTAAPAAAARSLVTFPAGHVAAMLGLLRPLSVGGTTVVMDRWSARHAAALVEEHRLTNSAGTPFFLATLLDAADRDGRDISTMRQFLVGAATVPPALVARAEARGVVSWRMYGSTEHPAITGGTPDDPLEKRRFTDGRPGPGNEVRLVDADGRDVERGTEGEILARGPKQFLGYRDAALDDDAFFGSWFRTGDLGRFDDDGHLVVTDRIKDIIIRGGENISAREIEDVLSGCSAVAEVAVCAGPDELWGERVVAFVRPTGDATPTLDDLTAHARAAGLAAHKTPVDLELVNDFPRTASGKIRKAELRDTLWRAR
jgi:acyl-CoA synthetase (AMP-forming)/AMP-acid ligase II